MPATEIPQERQSEYELRNVNELFAEAQSRGGRIADAVAKQLGSWHFIIIQSLVMLAWILFNASSARAWDPYPFILMNLVLSTQAAFAGPVILMAQNRQAARDRLEAHNDFLVDQHSAAQVDRIMQQMREQNEALAQIQAALADLQAQLNAKPQST
jgi:uncharacterized membrane protein